MLLTGLAARAQVAPAAAATPPAATVASAPDTVAALHRLFAAERRARYVGAGFFAVLGIGATAAYATPGNGLQNNASFLLIAVTGLSGSVGLAAGSCRYSRKQEQQAIEAYQTHRLPPGIRQKLQPAFFPQPAPAN